MKKAFIILVILIVISSCSTLGIDSGIFIDNLAGAIQTGAEEVTPQMETQLGNEIIKNTLGVYRIWNRDPALIAELNRICAVLSEGYEVKIIDSDEINAFSVPPGEIYITRGLVNIAVTEDAKAAIIAHHIGHIKSKHIAAMIKRYNQNSAALRIAGSRSDTRQAEIQRRVDRNIPLTYQDNPLPSDAVIDMLNQVNNETSGYYSIEQEIEADNFAKNLLTNSGYNSAALIELLQNIPGGGNVTARRIANLQRSR